MSYNTEFKGKFSLNTKLDDVTFKFLKELNETRRMVRKVDAVYGIDGEFFVKDEHSNVVDTNKQPRTQPSLWCQWTPTEDRMHIEWDGGEKFYKYIEWIEYLISKVLAPRGYVVNGNVRWRGEDFDDSGVIEINDNIVMGKRLIIDYSINKVLGSVDSASGWKKSTSVKCPVGIKKDGSKTRHQLAKERQEEQTRQLEAQIKLLEEQLKNKEKELKREVEKKEEIKKLTVQDLMLEKMRGQVKFGGSLDDFKSLLKNLLEG